MYAAEYDKIKKQIDEYLVSKKPEKENDGGKWVDTMNRYRNLHSVLEEAFQRAAFGKGSSRHSDGNEPFESQFILRGGRRFGLGALQFQIAKKNEEVKHLNTVQAKVNELLDIAIYAAAAVILLREGNEGDDKK